MLAPTVPVQAQWAEPGREVGRFVEHAALEKEKETPETSVVSDGVEGVSFERVRQLTAEQTGSAPRFREETVGR